MTFSIEEIIDMAIEIEKSGCYFYERCAEKFPSSELKNTFEYLAREESQHKTYFEKHLEVFNSHSGDLTEEYFLYLKSIGETRVFKSMADIDQLLKNISDIKDIFNLGIQVEKDSILLYSELMDMFKDNSMKTIIQKIIVEERKHLTNLMRLK